VRAGLARSSAGHVPSRYGPRFNGPRNDTLPTGIDPDACGRPAMPEQGGRRGHHLHLGARALDMAVVHRGRPDLPARGQKGAEDVKDWPGRQFPRRLGTPEQNFDVLRSSPPLGSRSRTAPGCSGTDAASSIVGSETVPGETRSATPSSRSTTPPAGKMLTTATRTRGPSQSL
jgi:hypothetical protein